MPNVIYDLNAELLRVEILLPMLEAERYRQAKNMVDFGRHALSVNNYEAMREALDDLRDFGKPPEKK